MAHEIFVCHASEDAPHAQRIVTALEARGFSCWIAPRDVLPGRDYAESIVDALDKAITVVVVVSARANASRHVRREVEHALNANCRVVPVRIDREPLAPALQYLIGTSQWIDAKGGWSREHVDRLVAALGEPDGGAPKAVAPEPQRRRLPARRVVIGAAAVVIAGLIVGVLVAWARPGDDDGETVRSRPGAIPPRNGVLSIGSLLPRTGSLAWLGESTRAGVTMAQRDINAAGGVLGHDITIIDADDGSDPAIASDAAGRLLETDVDVVVGPAAYSATMAVIDELTRAPVIECSPLNIEMTFTKHEDDGYYFRTAPPDTLQSLALADLITSDGHRDVVIIARKDDYGGAWATRLRRDIEAASGVVARIEYYDADKADYADIVGTVARADPDAIALIATVREGAAILKAAIAAGVGPADRQWYGTEGIQGSRSGAGAPLFEHVDAADPASVEGVRGTAPAIAPLDGESFADAFTDFAGGMQPAYAAHAYDCVLVAALAAVDARSDAPEALKTRMTAVTRDGTKCTRFDQCATLIADGTDIDYDGASGPLEFNDAGEPTVGAYDVWEFDAQGRLRTVEASQRWSAP